MKNLRKGGGSYEELGRPDASEGMGTWEGGKLGEGVNERSREVREGRTAMYQELMSPIKNIKQC